LDHFLRRPYGLGDDFDVI